MYDVEKLRKIRKESHLTVYDMASKLNISPSFYSQIENKKRRLFYDTAISIAHIFNTTPDKIFYTK